MKKLRNILSFCLMAVLLTTSIYLFSNPIKVSANVAHGCTECSNGRQVCCSGYSVLCSDGGGCVGKSQSGEITCFKSC